MANAREISTRIKSIQDTMKITKAMYMMSSMKLRKARQKLENTEPYFYGLQEQIADILLHFPDMKHLYFDNRGKDLHETSKRRAFIVITGDKGMAGAYNHNVLKEAQKMVDESDSYRLFVVGELGRHFFSSQGYTLEEGFCYSANNPSIHRARMITERIVELYKEEEFDEVYVVYTKMVNSMKEEVEVQEILPLKTHEFIKKELLEDSQKGLGNSDREAAEQSDDWFLIYPSPKKVLEKLVYNYVTGFMYGVLVEGSASEENVRNAFHSLQLGKTCDHSGSDNGLDRVAGNESHGSHRDDRQRNAGNGGLHDEAKQIVKHNAAGDAGEQITCGGQRTVLQRIGAGFALEQRGDDGCRQEADQEAGARADQCHGGSAACEHRQADRARRQIHEHCGAGLLPRQHQRGQHHHKRLQGDRHGRAWNRHGAGRGSCPHEYGEQRGLEYGSESAAGSGFQCGFERQHCVTHDNSPCI